MLAEPSLPILSGHQRQHHHTARLSGCECRRNRDNLWEAENDSAMVAGTPFVAMPSNTGKTKGMLDAARLGHLYESDPKETFSRLAAWTDDDRERAQCYVRHARAAAHDMFGQIAALASA